MFTRYCHVGTKDKRGAGSLANHKRPPGNRGDGKHTAGYLNKGGYRPAPS